MKLVNDQLAEPVRLIPPTDNGFLLLAAEAGRWAGPLPLPSRTRRRLAERLTGYAEQLTRRDDVVEAVVFRAALRPPGEGAALLARAGVRPARYDLVVLIRTTDVDVTGSVRADDAYRAMVSEIRREARHTYYMAADNVARIADVDHTTDRWFLFNYFHCHSAETVYATWEYTAGWFQRHTALPDSTLLSPRPGEPSDYSVVNHAGWPALRVFLPSLLFRRSFRSFVLANFKANDVAAQPVIYRRAAATGSSTARP
ncbi:hypothetical protein H5U98_22315 [Mycolicibacterium boenickei]|uniref:Uncharacterized protein n=1 Tax=Mycolicibacterium boenickei TaxID=146017 RepID=A0AAX2ZSR1_9MYCO|nr:hypothetical protein [Mycolicibacterium boenickei]PEG62726.1 hypothetical protein CQY21_02855 [Mycolicibacterium boenickei]UNB98268.1 hypothetical protein H5U98_22315 [Mycolicibacterium boenickei]BBX94045.1 hypothetical protein MBOE_56940 [Mycolicibacterium boenickei]